MDRSKGRSWQRGASRQRVIVTVLIVVLALGSFSWFNRWNNDQDEKARQRELAGIWLAYGRGRYEAARDLLRDASSLKAAKDWGEAEMNKYYKSSEEYQTGLEEYIQQQIESQQLEP